MGVSEVKFIKVMLRRKVCCPEAFLQVLLFARGYFGLEHGTQELGVRKLLFPCFNAMTLHDLGNVVES